MFRKAKFTLLTLAAFLVLGFSITVNASPPWLEDKDQMIVSAPMEHTGYKCLVTNLSKDSLDITISLYEADGTFVHKDPTPIVVAAGTSRGLNGITSLGVRYCTVEWLGGADDVRATFCAWQDGTDYQLEGYGMTCLELH